MVPSIFICVQKLYHLLYIDFSVKGNTPNQEIVMQVSLYVQPSSPKFCDYLIISIFSFASF